MENKEEYVIKCLTLEHGKEIIQHFKDQGVDIPTFNGSCNEEDEHYCIYYGVVNGRFSNYSLKTVQLNNIPIRELPKKELNMYSIKEIETNKNLVVYLDSKEEWNKLKELTRKLCGFDGQHCYRLYDTTYSSTSSKTNVGVYGKNATIITINQIKELNMRKEIIGYKLIKPEYNDDAVNIAQVANTNWKGFEEGEFKKGSTICNGYDKYVSNLKKAGVLDLWFEPVYNTDYYAGDWVVWTGLVGATGKIVKYNDDDCYSLDINGDLKRYTSCHTSHLRLATKEEIAKAQSKVYTLGIDEKFEISVKDKKAFYGSEDVTKTLLDFQRKFKHLFLLYEGVKYTWNFEDLIILSVGCIIKKSYLSQWLAIDLT